MVESTEKAPNDEPQNSLEQGVRNGEVIVTISQDAMAAYVSIIPPDPGGEAVTVDAVLKKLEESGVTYGIDLKAVEAAVQESSIVQDRDASPMECRVAWGKPPIDGEDARIDYHEALTAASGRPKVLEDGRVNLFDLNTVHNVPKGTVLAVETPPTAGEPGISVLGAEVPARPGRDLWLRAGRGTSLSEDKLKVIADVDGHAAIIDGKVEVTSIFTVPRDVGVETGNIHFVGSVVVRGGIQPGFSVKADGDVEVQGNIEGGTVEAKGNVTVQYGIKGGGRGHIKAGGVVKARFIENADVCAGSNVWATDGILQSRVQAGSMIEVLGKRGAIIGGRVMAKEAVSARVLGSAIGGATEIIVGSLPSLRAEFLESRKKQVEIESNLQRISQTLQYLGDQEKKGQLSKDKREMMARTLQIQEQLTVDLKVVKEHCYELERAMSDTRKAWVQAKEVCYPGVKIGIGSASMVTTNPLQRSRFYLNENGEIEVMMIPGR